MNTTDQQLNEPAILGQKYAFATASLLLGIASFISLLGVEKGILAILFGVLALRAQPRPALARRRAWGKAGIALGALHLVLVVIFRSRDYLTATRVTDWQTVRVFLGKEWTRHQPGRRSTFSSGGRGRTVTDIEFREADGFSYRLRDADRSRLVRFSPPN